MKSLTVAKVADFDSDLPEYDVLVDGEKVGSVLKVWLRHGGVQWTTNDRLTGIGPKGATRKGAVEFLLQSRGLT